VVLRIYKSFVGGKGLGAIAEELTREGVLSPSAHDPRRNSHRTSSHGAWSKSAIGAILKNYRYTGREVWGKQRRDEVLVDVDDVAMGYESKQRWNDASKWVVSDFIVHPQIVDDATFSAAEERRRSRRRGRPRASKAGGRGYSLSGLLVCGLCGRRMCGQWIHDRTYYRCRFPTEYALIAEHAHPRSVALREDAVMPELDSWLAQLFDPTSLAETCRLLAGTQGDTASPREKRARATLRECDRKLASHRRAIEGGLDPEIVGQWMRETAAERAVAERELADVQAPPSLSPGDIEQMVREMGDAAAVLRGADPRLKAEIYASLGLRLEYLPEAHEVKAELSPPWSEDRVGGGT
jgi:site-specific DNA recombinase